MSYTSFSTIVKKKVKRQTNFIADFERGVTSAAKEFDCDGVICGHIHMATIEEYDGIEYMNTGNFVEDCECLVETESGEFHIIDWAKGKKLNGENSNTN